METSDRCTKDYLGREGAENLRRWLQEYWRHRRKLLAAYQAARAEYAQLVANAMGGAVMVVDTHDAGGKDNPVVRVFRPAAQP